MRKIGLLGAFERDNFGDILFLERTVRYFSDAGLSVVPLSPFGGLTVPYMGTPLVKFTDALHSGQIDALWVVGGEIGGVAVHSAYRMLDPGKQPAGFGDSSRARRRRTIRKASGQSLTSLAYLPRASRYKELRPLPVVLNSVGLSGLPKLRDSIRDNAISALRDADRISVRERDSFEILSRLGVAASLAPDAVHTLRLSAKDVGIDLHGSERTSAHAVFQMSEALMSRVDLGLLAREIALCDALKPFQIRLLLAGEAPHHDSRKHYEKFLRMLLDVKPTLDVTISSARDPLDKVREIATSGIVIASSLHAMIVAMTFEVPRVGLYLRKLSRYAETWDDTMPTGVKTGEVRNAVAFALSPEAQTPPGYADSLAERADASFREGLSIVAPFDAAAAHKRAERRQREAALSNARALRPDRIIKNAARWTLKPLS